MRHRPHQHDAFFESLEQRQHFDLTNFASVGLAFETGPFDEIQTTLYGTEGVFDTWSGNTSGTTFAAGHFDRFNAGSLLFNNIQNLDDGRYLRHPNRGTQGTPDEANGARFLSRDGFEAGWWFADFGGGEQEIEWIVERPTDAVRADFEGSWRFAAIGNTAENDDFSNAFGELVISGNTVRWFVDGGFMPRTSSGILSTAANGMLKTNAAEYMYLSADKTVMIFADMAENDGELYIGIAVREDPAPFAGNIVGEYLLGWAFADGPADYGPNGEVVYRQRYLRLEDDGDYRIWDLDDYDSGKTGNEWSINSGEWYLSGGEVVLEEWSTGDLARFIVADNASVLIGFLLQDDVEDDPVLGLATRAFPDVNHAPPGGVITVPGEGAFGRQLVYQLGTDDVWEVTDLIAEAGGPTINGSIVTWIDQRDGHAYAAGMSNAGLILYSEPDHGNWTYRNLSQEAFGQTITSGLQYMIAPDGVVHITGLNANGQLVRYYQTERMSDGRFRWGYVNVETTDLHDQNMETPAFVGPLTSYATSWGGLNVAGVDANGRIWSVWWAPGIDRWTVSDLSAASGAGPIVGNLTVYLTPWDGINLAGLDANGDLQVTWWVPSFGAEWARDNLTALTDGPTFVLGSVTSYVSEWGGLNIAGMDESTGEIKVYWWSPENSSIGWMVDSISMSIPIEAPQIVDYDIRGVAAPDGSLNIFGYGEDGSYLNYYWYPGFGGEWRVENLSEIAVDR